MTTKFAVLIAALTVASPVLAMSTGSAGGGSATTTSGGGSGNAGGGGGHGGGGGGGGGHSGGGGVGHFGGGGMGGRGAAASAHGGSMGAAAANHGNTRASSRAEASRAAKLPAGQHVALGHSPAKMGDTDHHHHHHHLPRVSLRQPRWGDSFPACPSIPSVLDPYRVAWNDCSGPAKSTAHRGANSRS
jgi:hypothetical protein